MKRLSFLTFFLLLTQSCIQTGTDEASQFKKISFQVGDKVDFSTLSENILTPKCVRCHGWAADEEKVLLRVVAGKPEDSALYLRTNDGSMPFGGPPLTANEVSLIREFIMDLELD